MNVFFFYLVQKCDEPPVIPNGEYQMSNNESYIGTLVEYTCVSSKRYRLVGPKQLVCLPSGQYDNKPPYCKGQYCGYLCIPSNQ